MEPKSMSDTQILNSGLKSIPYIKAAVNVGLGMDVPTGVPVLGKHDAYYHNGGHTGCIFFIGRGNSYKSALIDYMNTQACFRVSPRKGHISSVEKMDTENNSSITTLEQRLALITDEDWFDPDNPRYTVTDATIYAGEKWFEIFKKFGDMKVKLGASGKYETPFFDRKGKIIKVIIPTFSSIDSLSRWEPDVITDVRDDSEIGDSKQNTLAGRANLFRANLVAELTTLLPATGTYMCMSGHIKDKQNFSGDRTVNTRDTPFMKANEKLSNIPSNVHYLATAMYQVLSTNVLASENDRKLMMYPLKGYEDDNNVEDLNILNIVMVRSKTGGSGWTINVIVSQKYGVLEHITAFHNLRLNKSSALIGDITPGGTKWTSGSLFYPDVKLTRTTVRSILDTNPRLQRAMNLGYDMMQMKQFWKDKLDRIDPRLWQLTPEDVYTKIIEQGYDWETILDTRYWWTLADDLEMDNLYLSNTDILRMALGLYTPYWLEADKKTIKKKYQAVAERAKEKYVKMTGDTGKKEKAVEAPAPAMPKMVMA